MSEIPGLKRVFRLPFLRGRLEKDVDEELQFHIEMRIDDLEALGLEPDEAKRVAMREFGDVKKVRDACRVIGRKREGMMRLFEMMGSLRQDVAYAGRQFIRNPGFSVLAVLTLALGIGATTVVFSVVNAVVLSPLPFNDADELVQINERTPQGDGFSMSEPNYLDFRAEQRTFTDIAAFTLGDRVWTGTGDAEELGGLRIAHSLMPILQIDPSPGRGFLPEEDEVGAADMVVLLARGFWEDRLGADPDVVGSTLTLDSQPYTVVGVVETDEAFPGVQIFTPLRPDPATDRGNHIVSAIGRLADGISVREAWADLASIAQRLSDEYPVTNAGWSVELQSMESWRIGDRLTRLGYFLLSAVGLLLLMACASVSNLLVARATIRQKEMGLRAALGAARGRILRQLLTESILLAAVATVVGVALAAWAMPMVRSLGPSDVARLEEASLNGTVLTVSLLAAALTVLLAGLVPALHTARGRLFESLRDGSASNIPGGRRLRDALVVAQFAMAIVVVLGAGLMIRSFSALQGQELGFAPELTVEMDLSLSPAVYSDGERVIFMTGLEERVAALPGVTAVGAGMTSPFGDFRASNFVARADRMPDRTEDFQSVSWRSVTPGFFGALDLDVVEGRNFTAADAPPEDMSEEAMEAFEPVTIIDENLARTLWPDKSALGERLVWGEMDGMHLRIVGVVETIRDEFLDGLPRPRVYIPYSLFPWADPVLLVRSEAGSWSMIPGVRDVIREMAPNMPVPTAVPLSDALSNQVAWPRFSVLVLTAFGIVAMVLAAMGVYGVVTFGVARRQREIGIRIALGAEPGSVVGLVLRRGLVLAGTGMAVGVLSALALSRFLESILFGTEATDPATYIAVVGVLGIVTLAACLVPAMRATRVDPTLALAGE